jgi:DNA-binding response OmpR family regulator
MKPLEINHARREVFVKGKPRPLSPSSYELITLLASENRAFSRRELTDKISGKKRGNSMALAQAVARLRKGLGAPVVDTVTSYGYRIAVNFASGK